MKRDDTIPRFAAASIAALLALVAIYSVLRGWVVLTQSEPNPALVIASARIPMFWRVGIGAYAGGFTALVVWFVSSRDPSRTLRWVLAAIGPVAFLGAVQGLFLP